jgi:serine/threonine protein kinase
MEVPPCLHPDDETLKSYGLGKLVDEQASTINDHLESCSDCRERVSGLTSDSFLGRFREGHQPSTRSILGGSQVDGTLSFMQPKVPSVAPSTDTLPPGLANHPDYEIKRELGRGGMGVVYLAHNTMMGRDEVLKVMGRNIIERPGVLERFQREIRAVAKLKHPNIVAAYHAFRIEGGLVFSMEYVEGLDLSRLVKAKGPLTVAQATYFVHQAALGLQHAHQKGLIHRDIKPHNLMLTHDGKARLVKVLDFGLAKATREEKIDASLTSEGQALGTPDYIAPEQIVNALDVDIRADLYSLGGTLFYLLTGRPPFLCTSLYDMYQAHMSRDAEPLNLIRPEVPAELAALVAKMMAKEPKRRFQTPAEVAEALKPFFSKAKAPSPVPKPEANRALRSIAPAPSAELAQKSTLLDAPIPNVPPPKALVKDDWRESLVVDLSSPSPRPQATLNSAGGRPPRMPKSVIVAASFFGLVALALGIIITIKINHKDGSETKVEFELPGKSLAKNSTNLAKTTPEPIRDRFVPLFNGKNLEGWTQLLSNGSEWKVVEGGLLEGRGNGNGKWAVLVSKREDFANFRLRAKFRYTRGDFGVIEFRRVMKETNSFAYHVAAGRMAGIRSVSTGSLSWASGYQYGKSFDWKLKTEVSDFKPYTWYTLEISAIGNRITTSVNGQKLVEYLDGQERYRRGAIALVSNGVSTMQFQEVLIETLPDDDTTPVKLRTAPESAEVKPAPPVALSDLDRVATGKWVRLVDSETVLTDPVRTKLQDGILEMNASDMDFLKINARDVVIRSKVRKVTGQHVKLLVRSVGVTGIGAWFNGTADGGDLFGISRAVDDKTKSLTTSHIGRKIEPDQFVEMALAAIGDTVMLFVDGTKVLTVKDDEVQKGSVRIRAFRGRSLFKDVECQILDPETKKLAGSSPANDQGSMMAPPLKPKGAKAVDLTTTLNKQIPMKYHDGIKLGPFLTEIKKASRGPDDLGVQIQVDPFGLQDADKSLDSTVHINVSGLPLHQTLRVALEELSLDYRAVDGLLLISSKEGFKEGGTGKVEVRSDRTPESRAVLAALETSIPMRYPPETSLQTVIDDIEKEIKMPGGSPLPIHVDRNGLHEAEKTMDSKITLDLEGIPLKVTLHWVLHQIGMDYFVKDGLLTITDWGSIPKELEAQKVTDAPQSLGQAPAPVAMPPVLPAVVESGTWRVEGTDLVQSGGAGTILIGDKGLSSFDLKFEGQVESGEEGFVALFHHANGQNLRFFHVGEVRGTRVDLGSILKGKEIPGKSRQMPIAKGKWYEVLLKVRGPKASYYIDGKELYNDESPQLSVGKIGLATWAANARYRNIVITTPEGKLVWSGLPDLGRQSEKVVGDPTTSTNKPVAPVAISDLDRVAIGKWVRLEPSVMDLLDDKNAKYVDGTLELNNTHLDFHEINARDIIVRARVRKVSGQNLGMNVRQNGLAACGAWFNGAADGGNYYGIGIHLPPWQPLGTGHFGLKVLPEQFVDMAYAAIGDTVTLYVDGKKALTAKNNDVVRGHIRFGALRGKSLFRQIQYQILDPVPASEGKRAKSR